MPTPPGCTARVIAGILSASKRLCSSLVKRIFASLERPRYVDGKHVKSKTRATRRKMHTIAIKSSGNGIFTSQLLIEIVQGPESDSSRGESMGK